MLHNTRTYSASESAQFSGAWPIMGARIDNYTNQWLRIGGAFGFVPPYTYGITFPLLGAGALILARETPSPALLQASPITGEQYIATIYNEPVADSPGLPVSFQQGTPSQYVVITVPVLVAPGANIGNDQKIRMACLRASSTNVADVQLFSNALHQYPIAPGEAISIAIDNLNKISFYGTPPDVLHILAVT